jgi:hypothetical protein
MAKATGVQNHEWERAPGPTMVCRNCGRIWYPDETDRKHSGRCRGRATA